MTTEISVMYGSEKVNMFFKQVLFPLTIVQFPSELKCSILLTYTATIKMLPFIQFRVKGY